MINIVRDQEGGCQSHGEGAEGDWQHDFQTLAVGHPGAKIVTSSPMNTRTHLVTRNLPLTYFKFKFLIMDWKKV